MTSGYIDGGAGVALVSASGNINDSTLLGGSSDDTFDLSQSLVGNSRIITGAGNDVVKFLGTGMANTFTGASIVGGAGNDSIEWKFGVSNTNTGSATNTYFFGSSGGLDTLSFATKGTTGGSGEYALTIAIDESYGATSGFTFTTSTSLITIASGSASIFVAGMTGDRSQTNGQASHLGFTLTTVSSSVITDLG